MEIIPVSVNDYDTYVELLLRRDACKKRANDAQIGYIREFGELITESFKQQIECIAKKKSIAFYQMAANRGETVNADDLNAWLRQEMEEYEHQLTGMLKDYQACRDARVVSAFDTAEIKRIYHRIAKLIHPDMHPKFVNTEELNELWLRVKAAYQGNDLASIQELEILVNRFLKENGIKDAEKMLEVTDLQEKIRKLKEEIEKITTTAPYIYEKMLEDEDAVAKKKRELLDEIDNYVAYSKQLDEVLRGFLKDEVIVKWPMN